MKLTKEERLKGAMDWLSEKHCGEWCSEYGEPGYRQPEKGIVFCNWNNVPKGLANFLEANGYELEWGDEWYIDYNHSKAWRTSSNSYGWECQVHYADGDVITPDDDDSVWIEEMQMTDQGHPCGCLPSRIPDSSLEAEGFILERPRLESGWFPGQTDDPAKVAKLMFDAGAEAVVFRRVENSQFYTRFSCFVRWPTVLEIRAEDQSDGTVNWIGFIVVEHSTYLAAWREMQQLEKRYG